MRVVSAHVQVLADVLAALFEEDRTLAGRANAASRRLHAANDSGGGERAPAIHAAFADYQSVAEQRRVLGADVGEAVERLIAAMSQAGFSDQEARQADVHALRDGIYQPRQPRGPKRP